MKGGWLSYNTYVRLVEDPCSTQLGFLCLQPNGCFTTSNLLSDPLQDPAGLYCIDRTTRALLEHG